MFGASSGSTTVSGRRLHQTGYDLNVDDFGAATVVLPELAPNNVHTWFGPNSTLCNNHTPGSLIKRRRHTGIYLHCQRCAE